MSYTKIIDNLYLGSYMDTLTNKFLQEGFKVVINVARECNNLSNSIEYYKYDYDDSTSETLDFDEVVDLIHSSIKSNKKVFIHCLAGKSRSASFVIVYLMKYLNYSLYDAYNHVNNLRDIYPNLGFMNQMMCYETNKLHRECSIDYDDIVVDYIYSVYGLCPRNKIKEIYYNNNKDVEETMATLFNLNSTV